MDHEELIVDHPQANDFAGGELTIIDVTNEYEILQNSINEFISKLHALKEILLNLADELDKHHKNVNTAQVVGASIGLGVSLPLAITSFALAFVTFGATIPVGIAAATAGLAAGGTVAGSSLVETYISKNAQKDINKHLIEVSEYSKHTINLVEEFKRLIEDAIKNGMWEKLPDKVQMLYSNIKEDDKFGLLCVGLHESAVPVQYVLQAAVRWAAIIDGVDDIVLGAARGASTAAASGSRTAFEVMGTGARALHVLGFAAALAGAGLDIYILVTRAKELYHKTGSTVGDAIRELVVRQIAFPGEQEQLAAKYGIDLRKDANNQDSEEHEEDIIRSTEPGY